eukprot:1179644-Prymnesium_polylepis.1
MYRYSTEQFRGRRWAWTMRALGVLGVRSSGTHDMRSVHWARRRRTEVETCEFSQSSNASSAMSVVP